MILDEKDTDFTYKEKGGFIKKRFLVKHLLKFTLHQGWACWIEKGAMLFKYNVLTR